MSVINREDTIEYLMTNMNWHDEDGYTVEDADEKRAIITDLINGVPDAEDGWIPIEDKLPTIRLAFVRMDEQKPVEDGTYIVITKNGALCTARWVFGSWNAQFTDCVYRWARISRETMMYLQDRDMFGNPKEDK